MDEQIGAHVDEPRLTGDVAPGVNPRANAFCPSLGENCLGRFQKRRVIVLLRDTEIGRQVMRADEHRVDARHVENAVEIFHRRHTLDVDNKQVFPVKTGCVVGQFARQRLAGEGVIESLPLERPQLGGAAELLHLLDLLDVRRDHPGRPVVEHHRRLVRRG